MDMKQINPFNRKSRLERMAEPVRQMAEPLIDSLKVPKSGVAAVGGAVGLAVGSALVSSLRRRSQED